MGMKEAKPADGNQQEENFRTTDSVRTREWECEHPPVDCHSFEFRNLSTFKMKLYRLSSLFIFHALNLLLLWMLPGAVPIRDIRMNMAGIGLLYLVTINPQYNKHKATLHKTDLFRWFFKILSSCEVLFTVFLPWWLIWTASDASLRSQMGYILAPHLFVFQAQIGMEGLIYDDSQLMFDYTVILNLYRGLALLEWLSRSKTAVDASFAAPTWLSYVAILLWICSNSFIYFIWRPCLVHETK